MFKLHLLKVVKHCFCNFSEGESIVATSRARITHHNDAVIYCWIPTSCIAAIFCIYNLVHAGIITAGFMRTCTQYRGYIARVSDTKKYVYFCS